MPEGADGPPPSNQAATNGTVTRDGASTPPTGGGPAVVAQSPAFTSPYGMPPPYVAPTPAPSKNPNSTFARQGYFVIGAERLTAAYQSKASFHSSRTINLGGTRTPETVDGSTNQITVAFLGSAGGSWSVVPRFGLDLFVLDRLSLGMSLAYVSRAGSSTSTATVGQSGSSSSASSTVDTPGTSGWIVSPRVGYAVMLNDNIGFWGRAGFTYINFTLTQQQPQTDPTTGTTRTVVTTTEGSLPALALEPLFLFSPVDHFGIVMGPFLDLALGGSVSFESTGQPKVDQEEKQTSYGVTLGIAGWF